jgi:hypothetical protein
MHNIGERGREKKFIHTCIVAQMFYSTRGLRKLGYKESPKIVVPPWQPYQVRSTIVIELNRVTVELSGCICIGEVSSIFIAIPGWPADF